MPTLRSARADGSPEIEIEIVDFGDGAALLLLAEYDAEKDTIRINARAVERVRASAGPAQAEKFVACAIAHERFHRAYPDATEAAAHAYVRRTTGGDPLRFETCVRDTIRERA